MADYVGVLPYFFTFVAGIGVGVALVPRRRKKLQDEELYEHLTRWTASDPRPKGPPPPPTSSRPGCDESAPTFPGPCFFEECQKGPARFVRFDTNTPGAWANLAPDEAIAYCRQCGVAIVLDNTMARSL